MSEEDLGKNELLRGGVSTVKSTPAMHSNESVAELDDAIAAARENADESHRAAMNSYGAGYDAGYFSGLRRAKEILATEQDEETARTLMRECGDERE